jgi:hypothetical protein
MKYLSRQIMKYLSRKEQRDRHEARSMLSLGLEAHLRNLINDAHNGEQGALVDFQQSIQYAPQEMRDRIITFLAKEEHDEIAADLVLDEEEF